MDKKKIRKRTDRFPISEKDMKKILGFAELHRKDGREVQHVVEGGALVTYLITQ